MSPVAVIWWYHRTENQTVKLAQPARCFGEGVAFAVTLLPSWRCVSGLTGTKRCLNLWIRSKRTRFGNV